MPTRDRLVRGDRATDARTRQGRGSTVVLVGNAEEALELNLLGVVLHPEAVAEALAAKAWYQERSLRAAQAFVRELDRVMEQPQASPLRWPAGAHGMRRILLRRFPFGIVYRLTPAHDPGDRRHALAPAARLLEAPRMMLRRG